MAINNNLFPPIISTYMPAFIKSRGCKIYFSLSDYNSKEDIKNVQVTVRGQNTNTSMLNSSIYTSEIKITDLLKDDNGYYIEILPDDMKGGVFQSNIFYKVQLRFTAVGANDVTNSTGIATWLTANQEYFSEWSTVCLIKGISEPIVTLTGLPASILTTSTFSIVGSLTFNEIETERLSSYIVKLYRDSVLIENSGIIYSNIYNSNEFNYALKSLLEEEYEYTIQLQYTTNNNYSAIEVYTFEVNLGDAQEIIDGTITAIPNAEDGLIEISATINSIENWSGELIIRRAQHTDNFIVWEDIEDIQLTPLVSTNIQYAYKDKTIQSGVWYKYGIEGITADGNRSAMVTIDEPVMLLLDDTYLVYDEQQLRIMYNPQISSYSHVVSDSVITTIGSQFPFVKRNGNMNYRQFNISGLISVQSDPTLSFFTLDEAYGDSMNLFHDYNDKNNITMQNDYNYERLFREKVISFLNDGEVKLFRSAQEGNILVRLTNISFTPEQQLGRLLYSFSATATEIADCTIENYNLYDIITTDLQYAIYRYIVRAESVTNHSLYVNESEIDEDCLLITQELIGYKREEEL